MIKLYLDCDGVILDSITTTYKLLQENGIDITNGEDKQVRDFYANLDWNHVIEITPVLNDAISNINKLLDTGLYDVEVLTHVNSENEAKAKIKWFNKVLPDVKVIPTKKEIAKSDMVDPFNAVLVDDYLPNLDLWHQKGGIAIKYATTDKECPYLKIKDLGQILTLTDIISDKIMSNKT